MPKESLMMIRCAPGIYISLARARARGRTCIYPNAEGLYTIRAARMIGWCVCAQARQLCAKRLPPRGNDDYLPLSSSWNMMTSARVNYPYYGDSRAQQSGCTLDALSLARECRLACECACVYCKYTSHRVCILIYALCGIIIYPHARDGVRYSVCGASWLLLPHDRGIYMQECARGFWCAMLDEVRENF